jgi:hypothetical protein
MPPKMTPKTAHHKELDEAAATAVKVISDASLVAAKKIADAAEEAHKVVADAAATSVKVLHLKSADDHDLLIELKTRMEGLKGDIKDIKDGTTKRIADLEQNKADRIDFDRLETEVHGKIEDRLRKLENASNKNWIYLTLYTLLTGALATLLITHLT